MQKEATRVPNSQIIFLCNFFFFCARKKQIASRSRGRAGSGWRMRGGSLVRGAPKVAKRRRTKNKCKNMLNESNIISFRQLQDQPSSCAHIAHQPKRQATSRCLSTMQTWGRMQLEPKPQLVPSGRCLRKYWVHLSSVPSFFSCFFGLFS